ncbi:unnamed protein product, partial [Angiostrongylus costaricensis]|uniref:Apple domain-containing protein n=1 Tax=Angiostrongylus costaricensis TaxID=334426 RepID=A0A158PLM5_ANGCS
ISWSPPGYEFLSATKCFSFTPSHGISNSVSFAELFRVTVGDCLNYCIINAAKMGEGCVSVVYHKLHSTCQLYGHNGYFNGSKVVSADAHDFYQRTSWTGLCQDKVGEWFKSSFNIATSFCVPCSGSYFQYQKGLINNVPCSTLFLKNLPKRSIYHVWKILWNSRNISDLSRIRRLIKTILSSTTEGSTTAALTFTDQNDQHSLEGISNTISFLNPTHNSGAFKLELVDLIFLQPTLFLRSKFAVHVVNGLLISLCLECPKQEKLSYFVVFGYRLSLQNLVAELKGIDQSSCVMYCSQNINAKGEAVPCYSVNYEPVQEKCLLYGERDSSNRHTAHLAADNNFIFADKFCLQRISAKKDCSAEAPFIVYPFKQMRKQIIASYPGMNSLVACVASCIDTTNCKAVTYKLSLCILHDSSPASDYSVIVDGSEQTMIVENGCQLTAETMQDGNEEATQWEEWGPCQFGAGGRRVQVRQRECTKCENLQLEPCS